MCRMCNEQVLPSFSEGYMFKKMEKTILILELPKFWMTGYIIDAHKLFGTYVELLKPEGN